MTSSVPSGLKPNSFVLCVGTMDELRLEEPALRELRSAGLLLATNIGNQEQLRVIDADSDLAVYIGSELHRTPNYVRKVLERGWDPGRENGALVHVAKSERKVSIHSDFLGTESLYYLNVDSGLVISNRLENISALVETAPDSVGVYEYLLGAFCVGRRTLLNNVRQSRPASSVRFSMVTGRVQEEDAGIWRKAERNRAPSFQSIGSIWQRVLARMPPHTLMLSAGWDSRLILLGPNVAGTYTHGDLGSREVRLTFDIASSRSLPMTFVPLNESDYSPHRLAEMNYQLGHAFFPHWYHAAQLTAHERSDPLTAGLFVEHFSGHYGINSLSEGREKLKNLAKSMIAPRLFDRLGDPEAIAMLLPLLSSGYKQQPWFAGSDWLDFFIDAQEAFESDVADALSGYRSDGTTGAQELCERFRLEHSGRQYFAKQTKCALPFAGYYHPYGDSELSRMVVQIPYRDRVNYKLSRAVVQAGDRSLLDYPMAATLVKAKHPILVQEGSRLVRIVWEKTRSVTEAGRNLRLGWNDFQFLNRSQVFHEYVDVLEHPIWSRARMHGFVDTYTADAGNAFSLLDMFSKILTVDHVLTQAD